jgi:WD40 repeat protein
LIFRGHHAFVNGVAFSPDGTLVVSGSGRVGLDNSVKLWNSRSGELLHTFSGHAAPVYYVAFGRGGRLVLSADRKRTVKVWDTLDKRELISLSLEAPYHVLNWISFRPDGEQFAVGCPDNTIQIRQGQTGQLIRVLRGHAMPALLVSYSPDGHRLVSFSTSVDLKTNEFRSGGEVKFWDPDLGRELSTPCRNIKSGMVWTDGKRIALTRPRTEFKFHTPTDVILMDAMTGREIFTLRGHTAFVSDLAFSPDGKRIATCGDEKAIKLWDAETGEEVFTLHGHVSGVRALRFSPDGLRLVSGGIDWTARVWDATPLSAEAASDAAAKSARSQD